MKTDVLTIANNPLGWPTKKILMLFLKEARCAKLIDKAPVILTVSFVSAAAMTKLNAKYRGKRKPTDILSFEQPGASVHPHVRFLGDLVLCVPLVKTQAKEQGHKTRQELAVLLIHGLLHLLGYDHEKSLKKARTMAKLERKFLKTAGLIDRT